MPALPHAERTRWSGATPAVPKPDRIGCTTFDRRDGFHRVEAPILLVRGDADRLVAQEMVDATAAVIAMSEISVPAGTGHCPMLENPVEIDAAVGACLDRVVSSPRTGRPMQSARRYG
ncbi:alpha/beta hydrolase (plasmid) [Embleya sp. NBC_00888]|uniref:alpha/beta fold hydrolase n=1 Tax=Embleya sp. NBC_00888 TaxID=2975960 RepID=UPI0038669757|nr:alpha/beta hydrolase [Embleya sp. NBC_00888]